MQSRAWTTPEFLQRRYSPTVRMFVAALTCGIYVFTRINVVLFAAAKVMEELVGISEMASSIVLACMTIFYVSLGGLSTVVLTDSLQTVLLLLGSAAIALVTLNDVGGFAGLREDYMNNGPLTESFFHIAKTDDETGKFPWTGMLLGLPVIVMYTYCADNAVVQRVLATRNR
jgi:SSS family solute:Na+ symporter